MIEWDKIGDEEIRADVIQALTEKRVMYERQAAREAADAASPRTLSRMHSEHEACARYSRRQAAHYQQAIDLLTAAPMPPKDEPR